MINMGDHIFMIWNVNQEGTDMLLHDGLYEQIINRGMNSELAATDKLSQTAPVDSAEASGI